MLAAALPAVVLLLEQNILAAATWTHDAVWPAMRYKVLAAVVEIREVENRFLKCFRFLMIHASS